MGATYMPLNKKSYIVKIQTIDRFLVLILKSNKEVEYIIINPWRICVGVLRDVTASKWCTQVKMSAPCTSPSTVLI